MLPPFTFEGLISHLPGFLRTDISRNQYGTDLEFKNAVEANLRGFIKNHFGGLQTIIEKHNPPPDYWHLAVDLINMRGSLTRGKGILSSEFAQACGFAGTTKGFKARFSGLGWTELKTFILTGLLPDKFSDRKKEFDSYL